MDSKPQSENWKEVLETTIVDSCIKCLDFFYEQKLNELKKELPLGLAQFLVQIDGQERKLIKVDYISLQERHEGKILLIEPAYFCIRSYRREGTFIYLEQTLSKPCVKSLTPRQGFFYEISSNTLATVRRLILDTKHFKQNISELMEVANEFYHIHCYPIAL